MIQLSLYGEYAVYQSTPICAGEDAVVSVLVGIDASSLAESETAYSSAVAVHVLGLPTASNARLPVSVMVRVKLDRNGAHSSTRGTDTCDSPPA